MKNVFRLSVAFAFSAFAAEQSVSPIGKVMELLSGLEQKLISEGKETQAVYEKESAFCEDRARELKFEIKTGKGQIGDLTAVIEKATADLVSLSAKIEDLAASISEDEATLKTSTGIRAKEAEDFASAEKELADTVDTIERATSIISREMSKGASMAQLVGIKNVASSLTALVQASGIESADREKLAALIQGASGADDEDAGAPDAAVYEGQGGGIVEALEGLHEKAEESLDDARKTEADAKHAFEMKKQGLEDSLKFENKDLDAAKKASSMASEKKAVAEGDSETTTKDLEADKASLEELQRDCMEKASNFEEATTSRSSELKALGEAKKVIAESTGGAATQTYAFVQAPAFLQTKESSGSNIKAVRIVRRLAFAQHSGTLARLASRLENAVHSSSDPFGKVKGLIGDMLEKLEAEASEEATQKAFCDKEMSETTAKKEEETATLEKLTTKLDQSIAHSTKLKEETAVLQKELAAMASASAEMQLLRTEQKEIFEKNKPEMEQGLEGVKTALKVLRDYYAAGDSSSDGAAGGIISLLEVCESDFSKLLASMIAEEEAAVTAFEDETKQNEITKVAKDKDVEFKTKEAAALDKAATELQSDTAGVKEQLAAVDEYLAELEKQCVAKAETYEDRVARRDAELAGLKSALETLSDDDAAALLQRGPATHQLRRGGALRGGRLSAA